jgi:hypothetical protein
MPQYRLTKASYLNDRYFSPGSVVEWDGPPNSAMEAVDDKGKEVIDAHRAARRPVQHRVNEVPQPGGDPADPTWAPDPRPAFAVKTTRVPDSERVPTDNSAPEGGGKVGKSQPKSTDNEASITRNAAARK